MPAQRLKDYLDREGVHYTSLSHSQAFTAQEVASSAHIPAKQFAKTIIVKLDGKFGMVVLPAHRKVVLQDLYEITGSQGVSFASESEFRQLFPDCEPGAMPPFGNLYNLDVYVAPELTEDEEIAFNAGTHTEVVRMTYADFARLVHPRVASFTT